MNVIKSLMEHEEYRNYTKNDYFVDYISVPERFSCDNTDELIDSAKIEEIMEFEDMPTKTYTEIINEMISNFNDYYKNFTHLEEEIEKLLAIIYESKKQCSFNIEEKATKMLNTINFEKTNLHIGRRVFYNRLKALDLLEQPEEETITDTTNSYDNI